MKFPAELLSRPARERVARIQGIVADFYGQPLAVMTIRDRYAIVAQTRMAAMALCKENVRLPLHIISACFGGRDHGTVLHAMKATYAREQTDPAFATEMKQLRALVAKPADLQVA